MLKKICCCCKDDEEPQKNETVVVVNNDDGSAIINQPTNKSPNNSFKFNRSSYSQSNGFVNDAVEFDEIDLNERQGSQRSRDKLQNNNSIKKPANTPSAPPEETIHVTGLMLDQLYEDGPKEDEKTENNNDDHLSREILEEYHLDPDVITNATDAEVEQASSPTPSLHRLTINLADEPFCSNGALISDPPIIEDPIPAPRSTPPPVSQWSPMDELQESPTVHETQKCPFELGTENMDECSKDHKVVEDAESLSTTSNLDDAEFIDDEPPYPANTETEQKLDPVEQNRMYGGFSSSDTDSDEENNFEVDSLQTTDRNQQAKAEYSVLSNEETDKSNAG